MSSATPEKQTTGLSDKARSTEECCLRQLVNKERDESLCKRVSGSLLTFTTSAAEVRRRQRLSERQVRKMAKPFCAAKRVPDAHKISTTFFVKKASMRRDFWYFLSAQKVHIKPPKEENRELNLSICNCNQG